MKLFNLVRAVALTALSFSVVSAEDSNDGHYAPDGSVCVSRAWENVNTYIYEYCSKGQVTAGLNYLKSECLALGIPIIQRSPGPLRRRADEAGDSTGPELAIAKVANGANSATIAEFGKAGNAAHRMCLTCDHEDYFYLCCLLFGNFADGGQGHPNIVETAPSVDNGSVRAKNIESRSEAESTYPGVTARDAQTPAKYSVCVTPWDNITIPCKWTDGAPVTSDLALGTGNTKGDAGPIRLTPATGDSARCFKCNKDTDSSKKCCVGGPEEDAKGSGNYSMAAACFGCRVHGVAAQCCNADTLTKWISGGMPSKAALPTMFVFGLS